MHTLKPPGEYVPPKQANLLPLLQKKPASQGEHTEDPLTAY